ncbi:MAG: phosphoribosylamine--glycine ligase, partial [Maricaulaceae bacterium]
ALLIEDFMVGVEASVFALCDGERAVFFGAAQYYKRAFDDDRGPNTGGMGALSPTPRLDAAAIDHVMATIIFPTLGALKADGAPYQGVLYAGLMLTAEGPKVVEFNCRFGDPETQVLMMRYRGDLAVALKAAATGQLGDLSPLSFDPRPALTVVMATKGYPEGYRTGEVLGGVEAADALTGVKVFQAGTALNADGALVAAGGRVLNLTAIGGDVEEARALAYKSAAAVSWPGGFYRMDIGD